MADADDSNSGGGSGSGSGRAGDSLQLLNNKLDKAVSTNDILLDLQRALTYEAVFSTLVEHKMQALKRDYEEHKRAKRKKRKSIGRILLPRKLFGPRRASKEGSEEDEVEVEKEREKEKEMEKENQLPEKSLTQGKTASSHRPADIELATGSLPLQLELEDSVASTLSNSSGGRQAARHSHSLLVQAQTHTPAKPPAGEHESSSSSSSHEQALAVPDPRHSMSTTTNGEAEYLTPVASCYDNTSATATATATATVTGTATATVIGQHSSTMADDSFTGSLHGSLESLSYSSSRCTVSFGGAEIIALAHGDADTRERARLAKRLRILEAKSISAQCSPVFPRSMVRTMPLPMPQQAVSGVCCGCSIVNPY